MLSVRPVKRPIQLPSPSVGLRLLLLLPILLKLLLPNKELEVLSDSGGLGRIWIWGPFEAKGELPLSRAGIAREVRLAVVVGMDLGSLVTDRLVFMPTSYHALKGWAEGARLSPKKP